MPRQLTAKRVGREAERPEFPSLSFRNPALGPEECVGHRTAARIAGFEDPSTSITASHLSLSRIILVSNALTRSGEGLPLLSLHIPLGSSTVGNSI